MKFRFWTALGAVLLALSACGGDVAQPDATQPPTTSGPAPGQTTAPEAGDGALEATTVRVVVSSPEFDSITVGKWIDLLAERGVTLESIEFPAGENSFRALAAGEGDLGLNTGGGFLAFTQQEPGGLVVIAAQILKSDYVLLVTPDIENIEDLEGKQIGISVPGDISHVLTEVALQEAGVDTSTIEFAQIGGTGARIAALTAGQISGGAAHVADGLSAALQSDVRPILNFWEHLPAYAGHFLQANTTWLEEHPNLAQLVVDSLIDANRWAQDNPDEFIELSREYVPDMPDEVREEAYQIFQENEFFGVNGGLEFVDATVEIEQRLGGLGEMPDKALWVDPTFVEDYLERNGRY